MSQTSSTPGRMQSDDSRQHQSLLEEIQRLKQALELTQSEKELFKEGWQRERAEKTTLRIDNEKLRSLSQEISSDQISIQLWQDCARDAERRAEEAELQLSKIKDSFPRLNNAWRAMGQALNITGQVLNDGGVTVSLSGDEDEIDYQNQEVNPTGQSEEIDDQGQQSDQASEGEEIDDQGQQSDQASEGEEDHYQAQQSDQAGEGENELQSSMHDLNRDITEVEYAAGSMYGPSSMYYRGTQESGPSPAYESETIRNLEDDFPYRSSKIRASIPKVPDPGSHHRLLTRELEGAQRQPLSISPPPSSSPSQPQQSQSILPSMGETTNLSDQPSANDTGNRPDITNSLDNLGHMERALPTLSGNSKQKEQDFPVLLKGSSQIPGIPTVSTASPIPERPTPIPTIEIGGWDLHGDIVERRPDPSEDAFYKGWPPMAPLLPKPGVIDSVAAEEQPEQPSPAKEASSATGVIRQSKLVLSPMLGRHKLHRLRYKRQLNPRGPF